MSSALLLVQCVPVELIVAPLFPGEFSHENNTGRQLSGIRQNIASICACVVYIPLPDHFRQWRRGLTSCGTGSCNNIPTDSCNFRRR